MALAVLSGCRVGPNYVQPTVPPPPLAFKETPANWKQATPQDQLPKGKWWEIYGDQELNSLEEKIAVSNQNVEGVVSAIYGCARFGSAGPLATVSYA